MAAWPAGTASNQARSRQSSERGQTMSYWFRNWFVPRAEFQKMVDDHATEVADLRRTIQTLREAQEIESVCSPEDFEVGDTGIEPPAEPPPPETNVVVVDFRRRFRA
jgi:hypothetical protein